MRLVRIVAGLLAGVALGLGLIATVGSAQSDEGTKSSEYVSSNDCPGLAEAFEKATGRPMTGELTFEGGCPDNDAYYQDLKAETDFRNERSLRLEDECKKVLEAGPNGACEGLVARAEYVKGSR